MICGSTDVWNRTWGGIETDCSRNKKKKTLIIAACRVSETFWDINVQGKIRADTMWQKLWSPVASCFKKWRRKGNISRRRRWTERNAEKTGEEDSPSLDGDVKMNASGDAARRGTFEKPVTTASRQDASAGRRDQCLHLPRSICQSSFFSFFISCFWKTDEESRRATRLPAWTNTCGLLGSTARRDGRFDVSSLNRSP